jgi:glycosyltransferase involved in cell wall biosynthesis
VTRSAGAARWPVWADRLPPRADAVAEEGGRRTRGRLETATAERPLVSYVTVVRDNAATLARAIESVQAQTYDHVEHVILDGASTDGTMDVVRRYADRIDYFASEPDDGLYDALNKAIPLASGQLICVLNSDDWLEPDAAATAVGHIDDPSAAAIVLTGANARDPAEADEEPPLVEEWYPRWVHPGCHFSCAVVCHNGIYATRAAYERSGPYDSTYDIAADFKWIMSCLDVGVSFVYAKTITVNYVFGGASADAERHGIECARAMHERFPSLTVEEAGGLYHTFFSLPTFPAVPGRPEDGVEFVRRLSRRYSDDADLLEAIAWASMMRPASRDDTWSRDERLVKRLVKECLRDHPRLYRAAGRLSRMGRSGSWRE